MQVLRRAANLGVVAAGLEAALLEHRRPHQVRCAVHLEARRRHPLRTHRGAKYISFCSPAFAVQAENVYRTRAAPRTIAGSRMSAKPPKGEQLPIWSRGAA